MNTFIMSTADPIANLLGDWSKELNTASVLLRAALIVILASVIGCERSSKRHSAGLRTFILISFSSEVAMTVDLFLKLTFFPILLPTFSLYYIGMEFFFQFKQHST